MTRRWKNPDGNSFTAMCSVHQSIRNFLLLLSAVAFKFSAWQSSFFVSLLQNCDCSFSRSMTCLLIVSSFRHARNVVAGFSRSSDDCCNFPVRFHGSDCWLPLGTTLQIYERKRVEKGRISRNHISIQNTFSA